MPWTCQGVHNTHYPKWDSMRRSTTYLEEEMHTLRPGNTVGEREDRFHTPLLVIGAGPYGLATAACAKRAGIEVLLVG
jgi:threonine dehydrogenase-like Zn-dependent dehydrogenase